MAGGWLGGGATALGLRGQVQDQALLAVLAGYEPGAGRPSWSANVEIIERERVLRGWTQRELARRAHVDPGTLSDLLGRRRRATFGTMQAICSSLNLTLVQVISFQTDAE